MNIHDLAGYSYFRQNQHDERINTGSLVEPRVAERR